MDDVLVCTGTSSKDAVLDASFLSSIGGIRIESSYTGTVTIRRDVQVRDKIINNGQLVLEDCTLKLGDSMVPGALVNQASGTLTTLGDVLLTAPHVAATVTNP